MSGDEELPGKDELQEEEDAPKRAVPKSLPALGAPPKAVAGGSKKDLLSYYLAQFAGIP